MMLYISHALLLPSKYISHEQASFTAHRQEAGQSNHDNGSIETGCFPKMSTALSSIKNVDKQDICVDTIAQNQQTEKQIARFAANSFAAHQTINAMLHTLISLCEMIESYEASSITKPTLIGQLNATAKLINAYTKEENLPFSYVGQMDGAAFAKLLRDIKNNNARDKFAEPWSLREKANAYDVLIHSAYFFEVMTKIQHNLNLENKVSHLVDRKRLNTLKISTFSDKSHNYQDQVEIFQKDWKNFQQCDARIKKETVETPYAIAKDLLQENRLTRRELRLARYNPLNRFGKNSDTLHEGYVVPINKVLVERSNGYLEWDVNKTSAFAIKTKNHKLPTVSGPSGTTKRLFEASLLLSPGIKAHLKLSAKAGEDNTTASQRTDIELKELLRWLAVAYLIDDQHHSMIEVNLGAGEHGLAVQWNPKDLYTSPFSSTIQTNNFCIRNEDIQFVLQRV